MIDHLRLKVFCGYLSLQLFKQISGKLNTNILTTVTPSFGITLFGTKSRNTGHGKALLMGYDGTGRLNVSKKTALNSK